MQQFLIATPAALADAKREAEAELSLAQAELERVDAEIAVQEAEAARLADKQAQLSARASVARSEFQHHALADAPQADAALWGQWQANLAGVAACEQAGEIVAQTLSELHKERNRAVRAYHLARSARQRYEPNESITIVTPG